MLIPPSTRSICDLFGTVPLQLAATLASRTPLAVPAGPDHPRTPASRPRPRSDLVASLAVSPSPHFVQFALFTIYCALCTVPVAAVDCGMRWPERSDISAVSRKICGGAVPLQARQTESQTKPAGRNPSREFSAADDATGCRPPF